MSTHRTMAALAAVVCLALPLQAFAQADKCDTRQRGHCGPAAKHDRTVRTEVNGRMLVFRESTEPQAAPAQVVQPTTVPVQPTTVPPAAPRADERIRHRHGHAKHEHKHHGRPDFHHTKFERPEKPERPRRPERPERPHRGR